MFLPRFLNLLCVSCTTIYPCEYVLKLRTNNIRAEKLKRYWFSYIPNFDYARIHPADKRKTFTICPTSITTMIEKDQGVFRWILGHYLKWENFLHIKLYCQFMSVLSGYVTFLYQNKAVSIHFPSTAFANNN